MPDGQLPSSQAAPAKVVLRRSISAGLAGALLPLHSPLFGVGFKLVVLISHNAGATLTVSIPQSGRPDKVVRVPPGASVKVSLPCRPEAMGAAAKCLGTWTFAFDDGRPLEMTSYAEIQTGAGAAACRRVVDAKRFFAHVGRLSALRY